MRDSGAQHYVVRREELWRSAFRSLNMVLTKLQTWYIAGTSDLEDVDKFWRKHGHSIHSDNFFMPYEALKKAPFKICTRPVCYFLLKPCPSDVVNQVEGDLVIIPPNAAHQVINRVSIYSFTRIDPDVICLA